MARSGFTVVEVLVALVIFALGALGFAAETAALTRLLAHGHRAGVVSAAVTARLERLRASGCSFRSNGVETVRYHSAPLADVEWTWRDPGDSTYHLTLRIGPASGARAPVLIDTLHAVVWCRR